MNRKPAFILFGGFKYPAYLNIVKECGLVLLIIDEASTNIERQLRLRENDSTHLFNQIDDFILISSTNRAAILEQVRSWSQKYELKGVCGLTEIFVETAAITADYLKIPSPGLRAAKVCRNKHLQRLYLREWSPSYIYITSAQRKNVAESFGNFPAVLKPIGRSSSSGVELVENRESLFKLLCQYPEEEVLLLEERIHGREFSVETLVQKGKIVFQNITQKGTNETNSSHFVEMSHTIPATNLSHDESERLLGANLSILNRLSFQDGISHGEYRITDTGKVYLMEIAARNPGDAILPLYHYATGESLETQIIRIALGLDAYYPNPTRFARQVYLTHTEGRLKDVIVEDTGDVKPFWSLHEGLPPMPYPQRIDDPPTLHQIRIQKKRGDQLTRIRDSFDRSVSFLIDAPTLEGLDSIERDTRRRITIVTD